MRTGSFLLTMRAAEVEGFFVVEKGGFMIGCFFCLDKSAVVDKDVVLLMGVQTICLTLWRLTC